MSELMSLIVLKETRHVLAAVTCSAKVEQTVEGLVGDELPVRGLLDSANAVLDEQFQIPVDKLDFVSVELSQSVLLKPRDYVVTEIDGKKVSAVPGGQVPTITFSSTNEQISVTNNVDDDTAVAVFVAGGDLPSTQIHTGVIARGTKTTAVNFDQALGPDSYGVLTFVAGSATVIKTETVP